MSGEPMAIDVDMTGLLKALRLTPAGAARLIGVDDRTINRWLQYSICSETAWRLLQAVYEFPELRDWLHENCDDSADIAWLSPDNSLPEYWSLDAWSSPRVGTIEVEAFHELNGQRARGSGPTRAQAFADLLWRLREDVKKFRLKAPKHRPVGMHVRDEGE